jgi:hypothetical protein
MSHETLTPQGVTKITSTNQKTCGTNSWKTGLYVPSHRGEGHPEPGTLVAAAVAASDTGAPVLVAEAAKAARLRSTGLDEGKN